jgi:branched-chain amino acid transport system permease protein
MINLLQLIISGILVGSIYGLIAMGFVIVYRSGRIFNMAYGQFSVVGAFMAWTFIGSPGAPRLSFPLAIILTLLFSIVFGLFVERILFRRMIGRPLFATFIMTLGLLAILNSAVMIIWGPKTYILAQTLPRGPLSLGSISLQKEYIWAFIVSVVVVIAFFFFFRRTRLGLAIRAAYNNQVAARCLGVSARLNSQIAWALCSLLATVGGILIASVQGVSTQLSDLVMVVLVVVLVGGMDSLVGCIFGGLLLAVGENLANYYLGSYVPGIGSIFGIVMILLVLLFRPNGLFGSKPVERV